MRGRADIFRKNFRTVWFNRYSNCPDIGFGYVF